MKLWEPWTWPNSSSLTTCGGNHINLGPDYYELVVPHKHWWITHFLGNLEIWVQTLLMSVFVQASSFPLLTCMIWCMQPHPTHPCTAPTSLLLVWATLCHIPEPLKLYSDTLLSWQRILCCSALPFPSILETLFQDFGDLCGGSQIKLSPEYYELVVSH